MKDTKKIKLSRANYKLIIRHIRDTFNDKFDNEDEKARILGSYILESMVDHLILDRKSDSTYDLRKTELYLQANGFSTPMALAIAREGREILNIHSSYYKKIEGLQFC